MVERQCRYWAIRTDKENREILLGELLNGKMREGWGYALDQDLTKIQAEVEKGGKWWERLSETQKEVLPHLRMLSKSNDSVQIGDLIIVPNLPKYGEFCVVEVIGDYFYDPLKLGENDINDLGSDYGHILPVHVLTPKGVNKYAEPVDARIRSTLRTPMRMWNIDGYGQAVEAVVQAYEAGKVGAPMSGPDRLDAAWEAACEKTNEFLRSELAAQMDARFQAAEWEEPIKHALSNLYPGADVRKVAGPYEHGADLIVQFENHFGSLSWLVVVQVRNYTGEMGPGVLDALRTAYQHYSQEGTILSLVVMTTADKPSEALREGTDALANDLGTPVELVFRKQLLKILAEGFWGNLQ